jgi:hypothetical protein
MKRKTDTQTKSYLVTNKALFSALLCTFFVGLLHFFSPFSVLFHDLFQIIFEIRVLFNNVEELGLAVDLCELHLALINLCLSERKLSVFKLIFVFINLLLVKCSNHCGVLIVLRIVV